jgi:uncharacterized membrane protein
LSYALVALVTQLSAQPPALLELAHVLEPRSHADFAVTGVTALLVLAVSAFFHVGLIRMWLQIARGEEARFNVLFTGRDRFLPMLGCTVLMGLAIGLGLLLFVVPGVIVLVGCCLAPLYVVDRGLGPVEALSASWRVTRGHWAELFLLFLVMFGLALLGLCMCCVGALATYPLAALAFAVAFTRITGTAPVAQYSAPDYWPR